MTSSCSARASSASASRCTCRSAARSVVLVDRRGAAEETSFGNAGLIQREGVYPYGFPHDFGALLRYGLQPHDRRVLPSVGAAAARALPVEVLDVFASGAPRAGRAEVLEADRALRERARRAGGRGRRRQVSSGAPAGSRCFAPSASATSASPKPSACIASSASITARSTRARCRRSSRTSAPVLTGALHCTDPVSVDDPQGLALVYLRRFERLGGRFVQGNAHSLEADGSGWRMRTAHGPLAAGAAVIALGSVGGRADAGARLRRCRSR